MLSFSHFFFFMSEHQLNYNYLLIRSVFVFQSQNNLINENQLCRFKNDEYYIVQVSFTDINIQSKRTTIVVIFMCHVRMCMGSISFLYEKSVNNMIYTVNNIIEIL